MNFIDLNHVITVGDVLTFGSMAVGVALMSAAAILWFITRKDEQDWY